MKRGSLNKKGSAFNKRWGTLNNQVLKTEKVNSLLMESQVNLGMYDKRNYIELIPKWAYSFSYSINLPEFFKAKLPRRKRKNG